MTAASIGSAHQQAPAIFQHWTGTTMEGGPGLGNPMPSSRSPGGNRRRIDIPRFLTLPHPKGQRPVAI